MLCYNAPNEGVSLMMIVEEPISIDELRRLAQTFGQLVKAVVDVKQEVLVIDAELHADEEAFLLEAGSQQEDLWGINFYPDSPGEDFIEYDSMINLRPAFGNSSRGVDDPSIREKIQQIVLRKILQ